jgi:hypothetical protein
MVMNFRTHPRLRHLLLPICILALLSCERIRVKPHPEETVRTKPQPSDAVPTKPAPIEPPQEIPLPSEPPSSKTYSETVSKWKSYQDLVRWMEKEFSLDRERFKRFEGKFPPPRTAEETFKLRSGIYVDAAIFAKVTLNRIDHHATLRVQSLCLFIHEGWNAVYDGLRDSVSRGDRGSRSIHFA